MSIIDSIKALNVFDRILWLLSIVVIGVSYIISSQNNILSMISALVGVSALIFLAKGDIWGQILTIIFSVLYMIVSFEQKYYGEMITYMCMTAPMAGLSLYSWIKNPFEHGRNEVRVEDIGKKEVAKILIFSGLTTLTLYFVLKYFSTASLYISTLSVFTSFIAS